MLQRQLNQYLMLLYFLVVLTSLDSYGVLTEEKNYAILNTDGHETASINAKKWHNWNTSSRLC